MYERILSKYFKITDNARVSRCLTDITMGIVNFIAYIMYFFASFLGHNNGTCNNEIDNKHKKFDPRDVKRENVIKYDLSVIIPVYNCENFIDNCIKSIITECGKYNYEIILINDGSTDNSLEKIIKYKNFKNIRVLTQENRGIAITRNRGLELAQGRYIMFVDADDAISYGAIEALLDKAYEENYDIVEGNYHNVYPNKVKVIAKPLWDEDFTVDLTKDRDFIREVKGFPWGRIYSRTLWEDVDFPEGFQYEDTVIRFTIFRKAKSFAYINKIVYEYTYNSNSISSKLKGSTDSLDTFYVAEYLMRENQYLKLGFDDTYYRIILNQFSSMLYYRTRGLKDDVIASILAEAAELLRGIERHSPKLSFKDKLLKKAILSGNLAQWKVCCKWR